jgi:hypothetical protein
VVDGNAIRPRADRRGELYTEALWARLEALAEEGSLFVAATVVPGTGVTATLATGTAFTAVAGLLTIANTDVVGGKNVIPLALKLIVTAAGTASTSVHVAHAIDDGNRGSNGTPGLLINQNVNMGMPNDTIAQVRFGVPTIAAAGPNVRYLDRAVLRNQIPIVNDIYVITYAASDQPSGGANLAQANASVISLPAPPIVIAPQKCYVLNEWSVARSAAQAYEAFLLYALR